MERVDRPLPRGGRGAAFWPWVQVLRDALAEGSLGPSLAVEAQALLDELIPRPDLTTHRRRGEQRRRGALLGPREAEPLPLKCAEASPRVVFLEDVHWADEASLDLLIFLGAELSQGSSSSWPRRATRSCRTPRPGRRPSAGSARASASSSRGSRRRRSPTTSPRSPASTSRPRSIAPSSRSAAATRCFCRRPRACLPHSATARAPTRCGPTTSRCRASRGTSCARGSPASRRRRAKRSTSRASSARSSICPSFRGRSGSRRGAPCALDDATRARLIAPRRRAGTYGFAHDTIRAALYEELPTARRAELHARVVRRTRRALAGRLPRQRSRLPLLPRPAARRAGAVERYARAAGEAAIGGFAYEDASQFFGWALEAQRFQDDAEPRGHCELVLAYAAALRLSGRVRDAKKVIERAIDIARPNRFADMLWAAARVLRPLPPSRRSPTRSRCTRSRTPPRSLRGPARSSRPRLCAARVRAAVLALDRERARSLAGAPWSSRARGRRADLV